MSFWQKLGFGLKKSSDKIGGGLSDIFNKKKLDSATLEELEDLLLTSDMGIKATTKLLDDFAAQKQNKDISIEEVKNLLAQKIEDILRPCEQKFLIAEKGESELLVCHCCVYIIRRFPDFIENGI